MSVVSSPIEEDLGSFSPSHPFTKTKKESVNHPRFSQLLSFSFSSLSFVCQHYQQTFRNRRHSLYSFFSLSFSLFVLYFVDFWISLSAVRVLGCHTIKKKKEESLVSLYKRKQVILCVPCVIRPWASLLPGLPFWALFRFHQFCVASLLTVFVALSNPYEPI